MISQNPQAFIDILNDPQPGPSRQAANQEVGGAPGQGTPPQLGVPLVTPQEKEAVEKVGIECGSHHHTVTLSHHHTVTPLQEMTLPYT